MVIQPAVFAAYPTVTVPVLIGKASNEAKAVELRPRY